MLTNDLTGADLNYWVQRANSPSDTNVIRWQFGVGHGGNCPATEPSMRAFVATVFGDRLPPRDEWQ